MQSTDKNIYRTMKQKKVLLWQSLMGVKGHLSVVVGHFCHISYIYLQNINQICHDIFGGNREKFELSKILLHMGVQGNLKIGNTFRTRHINIPIIN